MCTRPLRIACAESRDPWVGGQKQLHFWNPRPRFAYSLYNFYWATTTIKGRLLWSVTNAKTLDCVNFLCVTLWPCDLDLWQFNLEQFSYVAGHVANPATKFEDAMTFVHELRVITFPIDYHWKCVRGHCACAESREQWVGVQKQLHIWHPRPRFACSLCNFYWATTTIKGRLLSSRPMLKPFSGEKILSPVEIGPKNGGLGGNGGRNLWFLFRDPQKALPCADPRRLTYFASKSVHASRL